MRRKTWRILEKKNIFAYWRNIKRTRCARHKVEKKLNLTFWVNTVGFRIKCHTWDAKGLKNVDKKWSVKFKVVPTCRGLKLRRHADVSRADMSMFKVAMSDMSRRVDVDMSKINWRRQVEDLKMTDMSNLKERHAGCWRISGVSLKCRRDETIAVS